MYSQFRGQVLAQLGSLSKDDLAKVTKAMDMVSGRFTFGKAESALAIRESGLPDCVKTYLVERKIEGLSDSTLRLYRIYLEKFFTWCQKPFQDIRSNDIRVFLYTYQKTHDVSNRTLDGIRTTLAVFFSWAAAEEYITADPTKNIKKIKFEKTHKEALTPMELETVRHVCKSVHEQAVIEFLFSTGCRVSELVGVNLSDIDWQKNELTVLGKGHKHRKVYLNPKSVIAVKEYILSREDQNEALFVCDRRPHNRMSIRSVEYMIDSIAKRCPEIKKPLSPHVLRHTTATSALNAGMPITSVKEMLGHESVDTTLIYTDISTAQIEAEHRKFVI